jgi:hypothetical protein
MNLRNSNEYIIRLTARKVKYIEFVCNLYEMDGADFVNSLIERHMFSNGKLVELFDQNENGD